jgi:hypothetical protein
MRERRKRDRSRSTSARIVVYEQIANDMLK